MADNANNVPASQPGSPAVGNDTLSDLKNRLKKVEVKDKDGNVEEVFYRVEGDMLLDEDQLDIYARQQDALKQMKKLQQANALLGAGNIAAHEQRASLVAVTVNGKLVRWKPGVNLTYCVLKQTFASEQDYNTVVANMKQATWAWEKVCGVKFEYKPELDDSPTVKPAGVLFPVRAIDAQGQFIAAAFFPTDPKDRRRLFIDPSYFDPDLGFDQVGVLRHELGHVLGFRHEQIRSDAPASCPDEDTANTVDLTKYDPKSVMHYFCGGVGSRDLLITDVDIEGSQKVYGLPCDSYTYIE